MKAYYLGSDKLEEFRKKVEENMEDYKKGSLNFVKASDLIMAQKIELSEFKFDMSKEKPDDTDFENIKILYIALKDLNDSQASEERLWAGLCHYSPFWAYMKYRWNCSSEGEVLRRYFFNDGIRSIIFNGLARLWWYGRMTYDEEAADPFELTKYICETNLTLKGLLPLTVKFSSQRRVYKVYLRTLMNYEKNKKLNQEKHDLIRKRMTLWGGKDLLDSLSDEELSKRIIDYLDSIN